MKIRFPRPLVGLALVSVMGVSAFAQLQDGPAVNLPLLLKEIKGLREKQQLTSKAFVQKVVSDFRNASASNGNAILFYQNALMATKNETASDVQDISKMESIQSAARLHLNYLVMTVQRALGATTQQLEPSLTAHIAALQQAGAGDATLWVRREKARQLMEGGNRAASPKKGTLPDDKLPLFWEQKLITGSYKDSVFVKWYVIQNLISDVKDWADSPGDIDGIYQSTLLPYYRQSKDPRTVGYWDQKLQIETQKATATSSAFQIDLFNRVKRPQILWNRAKDEIAIGLKNKGITDMADIIRAYPDHQDAADWISQLEAMLPGGTPKADASASPAAQPSASAAAQPTAAPAQ
ncbi:MAG: hypothetical protein ACFUZC_22630 [Chthoniobacteraceae bacterium]